MYSVTCSCLVILMRHKNITPLQNYFLIQLGEEYFDYSKSKVDMAFQLTEHMSALQKNTTYMGFLYEVSPRAKKLSRSVKKQMIVNIMIMIMLDDEDHEDYCQELSYVRFIMEDIGLKSLWSYYWLSLKAWVESRKIRKISELGEYDRALEIMQDALSRTNLIMS